MKIKRITLMISGLFLFSGSAFAGPFDFENNLEFGLGVGYNTNYWNISESKLGPRAGVAGAGGFGKGLRVRLPDIQAGVRNIGVIITNPQLQEAALTASVEDSGGATALNGVDINLQLNYSIFSWLFFRSGVTVDIGIPEAYSIEANINVATPSSDTAITLNASSTYRASGLDIEIPLLLGFNLIRTEKFSAYGAIGINLQFGGYSETISASTEITAPGISLEEASTINSLLLANPDLRGFAALDFQDVTNTYNAFQVGLQWVLGMKYEMVDNVSVFFEVKWLQSAGVIERTGTSPSDQNAVGPVETVVDSNGTAVIDQETGLPQTTQPGSAVANALNDASDSPIVALGDSEADTNVLAALNRSYVRWIVGATYLLDF